MNVFNRSLLQFPLAALLGLNIAVAADEVHSHKEILAAAAATVRAEMGGNGERVEAVADPLDPRVRLAKCGQALAVTVPFGRKPAGRITAEVSCPGPAPWKIYVPVRLAVYNQVLVASRVLPRDSLLTAGDISLAEADVSRLDYGYLTAPEHVIGRRLRRPLTEGEPLTPGNLEIEPLIKRGQRVTLEATSGGLTVRTAGIAKSDGLQGQVIKVENLNSQREIQAVVRSAKSVEVLLQ